LPRPLIVLDTAVVVTALLGGPESSNAAMIREIATDGVRLTLSDDFLSELTRKVQDPNVEGKLGSAGRAFEIALDLTFMGLHHRPRRHPWRALRDPNGIQKREASRPSVHKKPMIRALGDTPEGA
jgi:predicted nucleic acid-binding protein